MNHMHMIRGDSQYMGERSIFASRFWSSLNIFWMWQFQMRLRLIPPWVRLLQSFLELAKRYFDHRTWENSHDSVAGIYRLLSEDQSSSPFEPLTYLCNWNSSCFGVIVPIVLGLTAISNGKRRITLYPFENPFPRLPGKEIVEDLRFWFLIFIDSIDTSWRELFWVSGDIGPETQVQSSCPKRSRGSAPQLLFLCCDFLCWGWYF